MESAQDARAAVENYQSLRPLYEGFSLKLAELIRDVLDAHAIKYQIVEARAKEVASFREKIARPGKLYKNPLKEIADLCGCRVIVYYQDDVDRVAEAIKSEFLVSEENLSRQPQVLEVDRFGYLSAHYVVSMGKSRIELTEWKSYAGFRAEIQIRTVVQHAWSAVSHALQYKQEAAIPSKFQRRLHRIAGLFELADEEFVGLRNEREAVRLQARRDIEKGNENVSLSAATIIEFLKSWKGVIRLLKMAQRIGFTNDQEEKNRYVSSIYDVSILAGIGDLEGLRNALENTDILYLERLWKANLKNGADGWDVNGAFIVLLLLIYNVRDKITLEFLVAREFDESVASIVISAFSENQDT